MCFLDSFFATFRRAGAVSLIACAAAVAPATARAQLQSLPATPAPGGVSVRAQYATVALVAAEDAVPAGRELWLGLRFVMDPGWHIYWVNPGDSGGPPTVKWTLPAGFAAGPFEWPAPERIGSPPMVNYGYHGEVTLPFKLTAPTSAPGSTPVTVAADLRYLICNNICVPGRAQLELRLPRAARTGAGSAVVPAAGRAQIDAARARVPRPAPPSWRALARSEAGRFVLEIDTGRPEKGALFFPLEESQIDDGAAPDAAATPRGVRFALVHSAHMLKPPSVLRGVVTLSSGQSYVVEAPVSGGPSR